MTRPTGTWPSAGAGRLAASLAEGREAAELFRVLATLRTDAPGVLEDGVGELRWRGPAAGLRDLCDELDAPGRARPRGRARGGARLSFTEAAPNPHPALSRP